MLVVSVRMKYLKKATIIVLIVVIISFVLMAFLGARVKKVSSAHAISSNEDRVAFLNSCGWIVSEKPVEEIDVIIPSEFNGVYSDYNKLQQKQGYDLSLYKGVTAKKYTYEVRNYPDVVENVQASVLIYKGRVIGGDVSSMELNGFMEALMHKNSTKKDITAKDSTKNGG